MPTDFTTDLVVCETCGKDFHPHIGRKGRFCTRDCYKHNAVDPQGVARRFWSKVDKSGDCWIYTGYCGKNGYGWFFIQAYGDKIPAHRAAYILTHGDILNDLFVCHNCPGGDNPSCVRPDHMFLGTHLDNMRDMVVKGHSGRGPHAHGSEHPHARLTDDIVRSVRIRHAAGGVSFSALARELGVDTSTIIAAIRKETWRHVE